MGTFIEPFDFRTIFVDYFLGSMELFIFGFIIIFSFVSVKLRMSNRLYLITLAIGLVLIGIVMDLSAIYLLVVAIVGLISFKAISTTFGK